MVLDSESLARRMGYLAVVDPQRLGAAAPAGAEAHRFEGKAVLRRNPDPLPHWETARDTERGLTLLVLGRIVPESSAWSGTSAARGSVTRDVLAQFDPEDPAGSLAELNGSYSLLILDRRRRRLTAVTDRQGVRPIYVAREQDPESLLLATHPLILLSQLPEAGIDRDSLAEYLAESFVFHPNTFFEGITSLPASAIAHWDFATRSYRLSRYDGLPMSFDDNPKRLGEDLGEALRTSVQRRTQAAWGRSGVLLSGGLDSRVIGPCAQEMPAALILYNRFNREARTAQAMAERLGMPVRLTQRDDAWYTRIQAVSGLVSGGASHFLNDHFLPLIERGEAQDLDTLLTGDYADWLFKGIAQNRRFARLFGRKLPWLQQTPFDHHFFGGRTRLAPRWEDRLQARQEAALAGVDRTLPAHVAWRRITPLFQEETSAARLSAQRVLPWDSVMTDRDVLEVAKRIPSKFALNAQVYKRAVALAAPQLNDIPHAQKGTRPDRSTIANAIAQLGRVAWGKLAGPQRDPDDVYGDSSWWEPEPYVRLSDTLAERWQACPGDLADTVRSIIGWDPWQLSRAELAQHHRLYLNVLTVAPVLGDDASQARAFGRALLAPETP